MSGPALPFPMVPGVVFPGCCDPDGGAVGVGGGVVSGESGQDFMQDPCHDTWLLVTQQDLLLILVLL